MPEEFDTDDLSDVIDELANGSFVVTRKGPTTYVGGHRQAPTSSTFEMIALITPASGRTLMRLPEGLRTIETLDIYTKTELFTARATGEPDLVTYNGQQYQVQEVDRWQPSGNFFRAIATKVSSQ